MGEVDQHGIAVGIHLAQGHGSGFQAMNPGAFVTFHEQDVAHVV